MKVKKIKINELVVSSFVTNIDEETTQTVKGGTNNAICNAPHLISIHGGICEGSCPSYRWITREVNEHGNGVVCL